MRVPKQARSRKTRKAVLAAAVECFESQGYDETTTASIARRAGIAVGTLYGYFRDKRDILLEILDDTVADVAELVIRELDPAGLENREPVEHVRSLIDAVFHSQNLRPGIQRILWERYFKDPEFREPFEAIRTRIREAIDAFVVALEGRGGLRDFERGTASFVVLNAVQWNATQSVLHRGTGDMDAAAAATADMIVRFLFASVD